MFLREEAGGMAVFDKNTVKEIIKKLLQRMQLIEV